MGPSASQPTFPPVQRILTPPAFDISAQLIPQEAFLELVFSVWFDPQSFDGRTPDEKRIFLVEVCTCLTPYIDLQTSISQAAEDAVMAFGPKAIIKRCVRAFQTSGTMPGHESSRLHFHAPLILLSIVYHAPSIRVHMYSRGMHALVVQHYWSQLQMCRDDLKGMVRSAARLLEFTLG